MHLACRCSLLQCLEHSKCLANTSRNREVFMDSYLFILDSSAGRLLLSWRFGEGVAWGVYPPPPASHGSIPKEAVDSTCSLCVRPMPTLQPGWVGLPPCWHSASL